jgi:hypothetical protein
MTNDGRLLVFGLGLAGLGVVGLRSRGSLTEVDRTRDARPASDDRSLVQDAVEFHLPAFVANESGQGPSGFLIRGTVSGFRVWWIEGHGRKPDLQVADVDVLNRTFYTNDRPRTFDSPAPLVKGRGWQKRLADRVVAHVESLGLMNRGSRIRTIVSGPDRTPYKVTRADFRPRTRPGFYQRGKDILRIDFVEFTRPQPGRHLGVDDWYVMGVGTLTEADKYGPSSGAPAVSIEIKVHLFTGGGWRRIESEKLKPSWRAFFDNNPPFSEGSDT